MFFISKVISLSTDCPDIINLAYGMNMHLIQPQFYMNLTTLDCCSNTFGISCTNETVIEINWSGKSLNGTVNTTAIPSTTTHIDFGSNKLTGDLTGLSTNYSFLDISRNMFSGQFASIPTTAAHINCFQNRFSGDIPEMSLSSLYWLQAHENRFTGSVPSFPNSMVLFWIQNNLMNGTMPILNEGMWNLGLGGNLLTGQLADFPSSLRNLYIDNNFFTGVFPPKRCFLEHLYLSYLDISGSIDITRPTIFDIAYSKISDLTIRDTSGLSICKLSNTPLKDKVDYYPMCERNNLYSLPTITTSTITASSLFNLSTVGTLFTTQIVSTSAVETDLEIESNAIQTPSATTLYVSSNTLKSPVVTLRRRIFTTTNVLTNDYTITRTGSTVVFHNSSMVETSIQTQTLNYFPANNDNMFKVDSLSITKTIRLIINTIVITYIFSEVNRTRKSPRKKQTSFQI